MNTQGYKSSPARLVRLFRKSRDNWKQRAARKQERLRALEVKVRDLTNSRDYWKNQALTLRHAADQQPSAPENPEKGS